MALTCKQGESITILTNINDSQVEYARDAHVQLGLGVKEIIAQGEKTHILYNQLSAKTHSMEVDIVNLKEASEQTAGLQHSLSEITEAHTSYDTTNLDFRIRIQEVVRAKLIQLTKIVFILFFQDSLWYIVGTVVCNIMVRKCSLPVV